MKTAAGRYAILLAETMNAEAAEGWEYVRSDSMPVEEKPGLLKSVVENYYTMLIFRRPLELKARRGADIDPVPAPASFAPPVSPPVATPAAAPPVEPDLGPPAPGDYGYPADPPLSDPQAEPSGGGADHFPRDPAPRPDDSPFAEPGDRADQIRG
ncbi:MAG: hypothetical protein AAF631_09255 [Pseudomonadota bacterium]